VDSARGGFEDIEKLSHQLVDQVRECCMLPEGETR